MSKGGRKGGREEGREGGREGGSKGERARELLSVLYLLMPIFSVVVDGTQPSCDLEDLSLHLLFLCKYSLESFFISLTFC